MEEYRKPREASVCNGGLDQDKTVICNIMQRFRPIAPKPSVGESSDNARSSRFLGKNTRSKRKYVRVRNKNNIISSINNNNKDKLVINKNDCNKKIIKKDVDKEKLVTLELLPEKDYKDLIRSSDENQDSIVGSSSCLDRTVVIESWLTVECVSDTCTTNLGGFLSRTIEQREERVMRMLEDDTCPWLISDELNRVYWVNQAYRKMMGNVEEQEVVIKVWLVVTMKLIEEITCMVELYGAVTCRVRVTYEPYTWRKDNGDKSEVKMTVPCDVWRMGSSGGFAWRLDLQSALTLGR